jgi:hypothetical protein
MHSRKVLKRGAKVSLIVAGNSRKLDNHFISSARQRALRQSDTEDVCSVQSSLRPSSAQKEDDEVINAHLWQNSLCTLALRLVGLGVGIRLTLVLAQRRVRSRLRVSGGC